MRSRIWLLACGLGCVSTVTPGPQTSHRDNSTSEWCDVTTSVLQSIVRSNGEQPLGLEKACVDKYAARDGVVYVDLRVSLAGRIENVKTSDCRRDGFLIRFDSPDLTTSPTDTVVLLDLNRTDATTFEFVAVTEDHRWRQRHAHNLYSSSPCLSSSGVATRDRSGWSATPRAPNRSEIPVR